MVEPANRARQVKSLTGADQTGDNSLSNDRSMSKSAKYLREQGSGCMVSVKVPLQSSPS